MARAGKDSRGAGRCKEEKTENGENREGGAAGEWQEERKRWDKPERTANGKDADPEKGRNRVGEPNEGEAVWAAERES